MNDLNTLLRSKLNGSFSEEQFAQIAIAVQESNTEMDAIKVETEKQEATEAQQMLIGIMGLITANAKPLAGLFKPSWIKYLFDFLIASLIIGTVLTLALNHILGACETSTILGGIVGYLLGKGAK